MATGYVAEFTDAPLQSQNVALQIPSFPPVAEQTVTFTTSTAMTTAANALTKFAMIQADADSRVAVGVAPTATAGSFRLPADTVMFIGLRPGHKVAFYDGSS